MKKYCTVTLLILATVVFATWQYRLLCVLIAVLMNKRWVKNHLPEWKYSFKVLVGTLAVLIFIAIPNYFHHGRTQLDYIDENGKSINTPLPIYIANVIFPEEEVMNICLKATALFPPSDMCPLFKHLDSRLIRDAQSGFWTGKGMSFYSPYNTLSYNDSNPRSFPIAQTFNEMFGTNYDAIYVTTPDNYNSNRSYPVVFVAHGYLGSWELYNGITSGLKNCIVVQIGTKELSGIYRFEDINRIFTKYLPYLQSKGYNVDERELHIIGISNGGTASNIALKEFPHMFKTITFVSTSVNFIKKSRSKVILIGGGKDESSVGLPSAQKRLEGCGTKTALMYDRESNHYIFAYKADDVIEFLNYEMGLTIKISWN